jgi:hypothetical protein
MAAARSGTAVMPRATACDARLRAPPPSAAMPSDTASAELSTSARGAKGSGAAAGACACQQREHSQRAARVSGKRMRSDATRAATHRGRRRGRCASCTASADGRRGRRGRRRQRRSGRVGACVAAAAQPARALLLLSARRAAALGAAEALPLGGVHAQRAAARRAPRPRRSAHAQCTLWRMARRCCDALRHRTRSAHCSAGNVAVGWLLRAWRAHRGAATASSRDRGGRCSERGGHSARPFILPLRSSCSSHAARSVARVRCTRASRRSTRRRGMRAA